MSDQDQGQWRNRIVGSGTEDPEQLLANPKNWRIHTTLQEATLESVLDEVGWVQQIIVNRLSGFVVDGHGRVALAIKRNQREVPVLYVELSEEEEALILATFDPISTMAGTDRPKLNELSAELSRSNESSVGAMLAEFSVRPVQLQPPQRSSDAAPKERKSKEKIEPVPIPARSRQKVKRDLEAILSKAIEAIDAGQPFAMQVVGDNAEQTITIKFTEGDE